MSKKHVSALKKKIFTLIIPILAFSATTPVAQESAKNQAAQRLLKENRNKEEKLIINGLMDYYKGNEDFSASFVQTTAHKMFSGKLRRAYGHVQFKKGGLMRWEYSRPEPKMIVYDGKVLWVYEPEVPQVYKGSPDTERLRKALAFLTGESNILKEYRVKKLKSAKFGFKDGHVLALWPKDQTSPFKHVELYLDNTTYQVVRSVVVDKQGNRNRFDFYTMKRNTGLDATLFQFEAPTGVPVHSAQ